MDSMPVFRRTAIGQLILRASPAAQEFSHDQEAAHLGRPKCKETVSQEARAWVAAPGGVSSDSELVLSCHEVQFGRYGGQTFYWLASNDVGYLLMIVAAHIQERASLKAADCSSTSPKRNAGLMNKDALQQYVWLFPELAAAVRDRMASDGSSSERALDNKRVAFGDHAGLSYREFYESGDPEVQSYRMWLRSVRITCKGSSMEHLKRYVLQRDQRKKDAACSTAAPLTSSATSSSSSQPSQSMYFTEHLKKYVLQRDQRKKDARCYVLAAKNAGNSARAYQNVETLHEFAYHPLAGAMLIFSVSFPIYFMYSLS